MPVKKDKILFIDDEKICHTLADLIIPNFTEYKLIKAFNGNEAIELSARYANEIAIVITDVLLPGMNGFEIYKKLKSDTRFSDVAFVFQSGCSDQDLKVISGINESFDDFVILHKPYTKDDLLNAINNSVSLR